MEALQTYGDSSSESSELHSPVAADDGQQKRPRASISDEGDTSACGQPARSHEHYTSSLPAPQLDADARAVADATSARAVKARVFEHVDGQWAMSVHCTGASPDCIGTLRHLATQAADHHLASIPAFRRAIETLHLWACATRMVTSEICSRT